MICIKCGRPIGDGDTSGNFCDCNYLNPSGEIREKMSDEILKRSLQRLEEELLNAQAKATSLEAENARLKEALENHESNKKLTLEVLNKVTKTLTENAMQEPIKMTYNDSVVIFQDAKGHSVIIDKSEVVNILHPRNQ